MKIEILEFILADKGFKKATIDIKIIYSEEKWEIFRNLSYFEKENRRWMMFPNINREGKWMPIYERSLPISKETMSLAIDALDDFLSKKPTSSEMNLF